MSRILGRTRQTIGLAPGELPPERLTDLEDAIFASYEEKRNSEPSHRKYLGASDIGADCARQVFYTFYHAKRKEFPGQVLRLFESGHLQEPRVESDLRSVGVIVSTATAGGGQHAFNDASGNVRVHLDGIIEPDGHWFSERMLLEVKTMNLKSFTDLEENGVKRSKPGYYRQMMLQLWAAQTLGVDKCIFVAVHKDTDRLYIERVRTDKAEQDAMVQRAAGIIEGVAPPRVETSENAPPCRWCDFKPICRDNQLHLIERNCRTCAYSKTGAGAVWTCSAGMPFGTPCEHWALSGEMQT